jgi:hypothetical protein
VWTLSGLNGGTDFQRERTNLESAALAKAQTLGSRLNFRTLKEIVDRTSLDLFGFSFPPKRFRLQ